MLKAKFADRAGSRLVWNLFQRLPMLPHRNEHRTPLQSLVVRPLNRGDLWVGRRSPSPGLKERQWHNWCSRSAPLARASSNSILLGVLLQMRDDSFLQDAGQPLLQDDVGMLQVNEGRIRPSCGESAIVITMALAKSVRKETV